MNLKFYEKTSILTFMVIFHVESLKDICDTVKHGLSENTFTDELENIFWIQMRKCDMNLCEKRPCAKILNAIPNSCSMKLHDSIFDTDFKCECLENSFWSTTLNTCVLNNKCLSETRCGGPIRAEECDFSEKNGHVNCKCRPEWMGDNCDNLRNACLENYFKHMKNGNQNCRPNGECISFLGSNQYKCKCKEGWTDDLMFAQPDCNKKIDKCDSIVCINGFCNSDGIKAVCICDYGWTGNSCQWPYTGNWYPWGPWSSCEPSCGEERYRKRYRKCIDESLNCTLNTEIDECSRQKCMFGSNDIFSWSAWSDCDRSCGYGYEYQQKACTSLDLKLKNCIDIKNMINIKKRNCYRKKCSYNSEYLLNDQNISIGMIMIFFVGLFLLLFKIIHKIKAKK